MSYEEKLKQLYQVLTEYGKMSFAGAVGVLANMQAESNIEAMRMQGDFTQVRSKSREYADSVRDGKISHYQFCHDSIGYGLCQWTFHTWKDELLSFGGDILYSEILQCKFLCDQLIYWPEFGDLYYLLCFSESYEDCTSEFCKTYEKPAVLNIDQRISFAHSIAEVLIDNLPIQEITNVPQYIKVYFGAKECKYELVSVTE